MNFKMGAIIVKGGKVLASGFNHHRTHYDGADLSHRKPASMHAEMHAIYVGSGQFTPPFSVQQGTHCIAQSGLSSSPSPSGPSSGGEGLMLVQGAEVPSEPPPGVIRRPDQCKGSAANGGDVVRHPLSDDIPIVVIPTITSSSSSDSCEACVV